MENLLLNKLSEYFDKMLDFMFCSCIMKMKSEMI